MPQQGERPNVRITPNPDVTPVETAPATAPPDIEKVKAESRATIDGEEVTAKQRIRALQTRVGTDESPEAALERLQEEDRFEGKTLIPVVFEEDGEEEIIGYLPLEEAQLFAESGHSITIHPGPGVTVLQ